MITIERRINPKLLLIKWTDETQEKCPRNTLGSSLINCSRNGESSPDMGAGCRCRFCAEITAKFAKAYAKSSKAIEAVVRLQPCGLQINTVRSGRDGELAGKYTQHKREFRNEIAKLIVESNRSTAELICEYTTRRPTAAG